MEATFRRLGYRTASQPEPRQGNVLVLWNRYMRDEMFAKDYEGAGGTVLVVENGYLGRNFNGSEWYAMARWQHNGAGEWPAGSRDRWQRLGVEVKDWRRRGREIVVLGTRHMGSNVTREPPNWAWHMTKVLKKRTARPVRLRTHPGPQAQCSTGDLVEDLADAHCAVTWGSGAGIKALIAGVPVFHGLRQWIGGPAARTLDSDLEAPFLGDRMPMLERLASAMWRLDELENGEAFRCLLA